MGVALKRYGKMWWIPLRMWNDGSWKKAIKDYEESCSKE